MTPTDADLARYGWAPGGYTAPCMSCGRQIASVGPSAAKRCRVCRPCAVRAWKTENESHRQWLIDAARDVDLGNTVDCSGLSKEKFLKAFVNQEVSK